MKLTVPVFALMVAASSLSTALVIKAMRAEVTTEKSEWVDPIYYPPWSYRECSNTPREEAALRTFEQTGYLIGQRMTLCAPIRATQPFSMIAFCDLRAGWPMESMIYVGDGDYFVGADIFVDARWLAEYAFTATRPDPVESQNYPYRPGAGI